MRTTDRSTCATRHCERLTASSVMASAVMIALAAFLTIVFAPPAQALPSFARQTGQPCGVCHTDFPGLTPYGRRFKIGGYTYGGGHYRTALFPDWNDSKKEKKKQWVPPIAMMTMLDYVHVQDPQTAGTVPSPPFSANDNYELNQFSFFWGGAITDHIGAFSQLTYSPSAWGWDNTDIRYANSITVGHTPVTFGITANNNPTVQDPWNTVPAWVFPYITPSDNLNFPGMGPAPIIDGAYGGAVGSVGAYAYVDDLVYLEGSVYRTLSPSIQTDLGADPTGVGQFRAAPYWRAAIEPHWGRNWLEFGTFGMAADVHPYLSGSGGGTTYDSQTVSYTDVGFDTQYQYQGDNYWLTFRGSYIHEKVSNPAHLDDINISHLNSNNTLNEARAYASVAYGNSNRIVLTGQYFTSWGSVDTGIYDGNGSPNTKGWIGEIAYIPFIDAHAPGWPWFDTRIGLQYTAYTEMNGTSTGASANDTLMLYLWMAM